MWSHITLTLFAQHVPYCRYCEDGLMVVKWPKHVNNTKWNYILLCLTETRNYVVFPLINVTNIPAGTGRVLTELRTRHYFNTILVSKLQQAAETPCSLEDGHCSIRINVARNVSSPATRLHDVITQKITTWPGFGLGLSASCRAAPQWLPNDRHCTVTTLPISPPHKTPVHTLAASKHFTILAPRDQQINNWPISCHFTAEWSLYVPPV
jgi:hypothetical protein